VHSGASLAIGLKDRAGSGRKAGGADNASPAQQLREGRRLLAAGELRRAIAALEAWLLT
jgi:hypothetical protein